MQDRTSDIPVLIPAYKPGEPRPEIAGEAGP